MGRYEAADAEGAVPSSGRSKASLRTGTAQAAVAAPRRMSSRTEPTSSGSGSDIVAARPRPVQRARLIQRNVDVGALITGRQPRQQHRRGAFQRHGRRERALRVLGSTPFAVFVNVPQA